MTIVRAIQSLGIAILFTPFALGDTPIPLHPSKISFGPLDYQVAPASKFRETLSNGIVVYIAVDRMLPTFDLSVRIRTGAAFDPPGKEGLASLTSEQLRDGGTQSLSPQEMDEKVEFLAASLSSRAGDTSAAAGLWVLSKDIDAGLALLVDMLRYPRFDEERLRRAKERVLQNIKRRNDSTGSIERMEWGFAMNGPDHFSNRYPTSESVEAITRDDMIASHRRYYHPGNMMIAVSGDFDRSTMLAKLEHTFSSWPAGEPAPKTFPKPNYDPKPGVYMFHKDEVNQGRVSIGHKGTMRGSADEFPLRIMDGILGAAGFRSRLMARVRSDEGLAYNTGSRFGQGTYYPGEFRCWFQSKSNSCAYAAKIVLEEIKRLRDEPVSKADIDDTVNYYVESFPQRFQSKMALLRTYVDDEYTGRDLAYWQSYVDKLRRVTIEDVQRVAKKYLSPDKLVIVAVGDVDAIIAGGHDKAPDLKFDSFGKITRLPLRNPETMQR